MSKTPYEFYKQIHPEQFSDSEVIQQSQFNKELAEYYLSRITSRSQEKDFENFCRKLAEKEICPNLLPQTGPTGGGDSKVDSETYPVSDTISLTWFTGVGRESSSERWAFAISAKKDWKPKLKSDVEKIIKVNAEQKRNYKKIFFISNQFISDKKRANAEDELRAAHSLDIRVLDLNWLLDKVFSNGHQDIFIKELHLADAFLSTTKKGSLDISKIENLYKLENEIKNIQVGIEDSLVAIALETAILSRELEKPQVETVGRFLRAFSFASKYGSKNQVIDCVYEWAWSLYWWYNSYESFYEKYVEFQNLVINSDNTYHLSLLKNLWLNLYSCSDGKPERFDLENHTKQLSSAFELIINNRERPKASLEARAHYSYMRFFLGDELDDIVLELINILNESDMHIDLDISVLLKITTELPMYKSSVYYHDLFELVVKISGSRKQEVETAKLLISRAEDIYTDKPYQSIAYLGRSLAFLFKKESKSSLLRAFYLLSLCFENIGCFWAARAYAINALHLGINEYLKFGNYDSISFLAAEQLKMIELQLGRVTHSVEFYKISQLLPSTLSEEKRKEIEAIYDGMLGMVILAAPFESYESLSLYPSYFSENHLWMTSIACKYVLGHYDEEFLEHHKSAENIDEFMKTWSDQPAKKQINQNTWFGFEKTAKLESVILGCQVSIYSDNTFLCLELSASILSMIESFFCTGTLDGIVLAKSRLTIRIQNIIAGKFKLELDENNNSKYDFQISCSDYLQNEYQEAQMIVQDFLQGFQSHIIAQIVHWGISKKKLEQMIIAEKVFDRSLSFSLSVFNFSNIFDKYFLDINSLILEEPVVYESTRKRPLHFENKKPILKNTYKSISDLDIVFDKPEHIDFDKIKQQDITINSLIDIQSWDAAKWRGVAYLGSIDHNIPPALGLVFEKSIPGQQIFKQWRMEIGDYDDKNLIKIGIIKGIDKNNPFYYRVIITPNINNLFTDREPKMFQNFSRLHTMEATSHTNLKQFEKSLESFSYFYFSPIELDSNGQISYDIKLMIKKNAASVEILEVHEIPENNYLLTAIAPMDNPILPNKKDYSHILKRIHKK